MTDPRAESCVEADLHVHSRRSDGLDSPSAVVARAVAAGLRAIALTDHDTLAGIREARLAAPAGFEVVPGVEISSSWRGCEVHLLAYDVDPEDADLGEALERSRSDRVHRAQRIVERLNGLGIPITLDEVAAESGASENSDAAIGRPHVAACLVRRGEVSSVNEAFARYLRPGRPAFVPRRALALPDALRLVRRAGGTLVVAHPALNLSYEQTQTLAGAGIDGLEVWHPKHDESARRRLKRLVDGMNLVATGGSDYHGMERSPGGPGCAGVPLATLSLLRARSRGRDRGAGR